jgi:hypothetical protein
MSSDANNSPYFQLENSMSQAFEKAVLNAIHPSVVTKVILDAIKSDDPQLRYAVGNDDDAIAIEARRNMSGREFMNWMKK